MITTFKHDIITLYDIVYYSIFAVPCEWGGRPECRNFGDTKFILSMSFLALSQEKVELGGGGCQTEALPRAQFSLCMLLHICVGFTFTYT